MNPGGRRAIYIATTIKIKDSSCTCVHRKGIYHNLVYNIKFIWNILCPTLVQGKRKDEIQEIGKIK